MSQLSTSASAMSNPSALAAAPIPPTSAGFRTFCTLTALVGVIAFAAADAKPLLFVLVAAAAGTSILLGTPGRPARMPRFMLNGLVVVSLLYSAAMVVMRSNVISDLTDFLVLVLALKLFDRMTMRDEAQLLGLSMFVVIGAVLTGAQLSLGLTLVVYTPLIIAACMLWQVHRGREIAASRPGSDRAAAQADPAKWQRSLLRSVMTLVAVSLLAGVALFVVTPRVSIPGGAWGRPLNGAVTGFSDSIRLGASGLLSESSEAVLDVTMRDDTGKLIPPGGDPLYLRGAVLDSYNAATGVWSKSGRMADVRPINISGSPGDWIALPRWVDVTSIREAADQFGIVDPADESADSTVSSGPDGDPETPAATVVGERRSRAHVIADITIRNASGRSAAPVFALLRPIEVQFTTSVDKISYEPGDATLRLASESGRVSYSVKSALDYFEDSPRPPITVPPTSTKLRLLAATLRADADVSATKADLDAPEIRRIARQIVTHLRTGFRYSLEMIAPEEGEDAIDMFLFRTRSGHCEYFASAMASLALHAKVPARIVTGYVGGEHNPLSGSYLIRASDAHAWVEVQTSPGRWETFDPTPPGELRHQRSSQTGLVAQLRQLWDAMEITWGNSVIGFEQTRNSTASTGAGVMDGENLRGVGRRVQQLRATLSSILPEGMPGTVLLVAIGFCVAFGTVAITRKAAAWLRDRAQKRATKNRFASTPSFFVRAVLAMEAAGVPAAPSLTPRHYAHALQAGEFGTQLQLGKRSLNLQDLGRRFASVVERYYEVRFGGSAEAAADAELASDVETLLKPKGV